MEARLLLWIHGFASPALERLFWVSHLLGTISFCTGLVLVVTVWLGLRRERRLALAWVAVGLSVLTLQWGLKRIFVRERPQLWTRTLVAPVDYSFPSGHALASAAFYPLLAFSLARRRPARASALWAAGVGLALFIGLGRLYFGVHWPSDVLAGWALGGLLCAGASVAAGEQAVLSASRPAGEARPKH